MPRIQTTQIVEMKQKGEKIPMLTAYDYTTAFLVEKAGMPLILVGDSLGMVMLGYDTPIPVTMDEMIHHCKAVVRGTSTAMIIGDMPFMTYHTTVDDALRNAARFIQEAGCQAVKLEGGVTVAEKVKKLIDCGIPVMGHIGLTPQSALALGGFRVQGRSLDRARQLLDDALALEQAGVFGIVLEAVPSPLSKLITESVSVPTIGIGAGPDCDGQVQVIQDFLGMNPGHVPKHAKQYVLIGDLMKDAVSQYIDEVRGGAFPTAKETFVKMEQGVIEELAKMVPSKD
jgi:3-methyl-2-oxobutanoate hydroxymethyltransferase